MHIAKREEDIGYYAGYVGELLSSLVKFLVIFFYLYLNILTDLIKNVEGASYMLGRALTSIFWGIIADRYGRKPVIIFATVIVYVTSPIFSD